jgi:hypothetical protein
LKIVYDNGDGLSCADEVSITVVGVESVEWVGRQNSEMGTDNLDVDPNWPGGLSPGSARVFPGARFVGGAVEPQARDRVDVKVTLTVQPVEELKVYLKSFDVDDPTADTDPLDKETDPEDNRGEVAASKAGAFIEDPDGAATVVTDIYELTMKDPTETARFQTTMQPGDNFRVVAAGDPVSLMDLHNIDGVLGSDNPDKQRIVNTHVLNGPGATPADAELRQADKYASDVLTVWRFLHLEGDSMVPVTGNFIDCTVEWPPRATDAVTGDITELSVDVPLADGSPDLTAGTGNGRFEKGRLRVADTHDITDLDGNGDDWVRRAAGLDLTAIGLPFSADDGESGQNRDIWTGTITDIAAGSSTLTLNISTTTGSQDNDGADGWADFGSGGAMMTIQGFGGAQGPQMTIVAVNQAASTFTVDVVRVPVRLFDDDAPDGWDVPKPDTDGLEPAFAEAFVLPVRDIDGEQNDLEFIPHMETRGPQPFIQSVREGWQFDNVAHEANPIFWTVYIRGTFQDTAVSDDHDPDWPGGGVAWGIVDMVNPITDRGRGANIYMEVLRPQEWLSHSVTEINTVVHEVGHLFHGSHGDGGVMAAGGGGGTSTFDPITLNRIRSIDYP